MRRVMFDYDFGGRDQEVENTKRLMSISVKVM